MLLLQRCACCLYRHSTRHEQAVKLEVPAAQLLLTSTFHTQCITDTTWTTSLFAATASLTLKDPLHIICIRALGSFLSTPREMPQLQETI